MRGRMVGAGGMGARMVTRMAATAPQVRMVAPTPGWEWGREPERERGRGRGPGRALEVWMEAGTPGARTAARMPEVVTAALTPQTEGAWATAVRG